MNVEDVLEHLVKHGVKPTANRILIANAISEHYGIFRTLILFREHHIVHQMEDGNDIVRYEICRSNDAEIDSDMHAHFYCQCCHHTVCLPEMAIPEINLPDGYQLKNVNFMLKGICPTCAEKMKR